LEALAGQGAATRSQARPTTPPPLQIGLIVALVVFALVAWLVTDRRMDGMDGGPGTDLGTFGFYVTAWVVMMAAMMFPSIAPMVSVYAGLQARRREAGREAPAGATTLFVVGYVVTWTAAGVLAYALFQALRAADIEALSWDRAGRYVAAGVLLVAAGYQLTPLKYACLRRCRGPLGFIIENWREGRGGALRMGIVHGAWCVGCCWALMAALFALGVMSVGWMVLIAAFIAAEKLLPWRWVATYGVAIALAGIGIWVAVAPRDVPGLTIPGSPGAMSMGPGGVMDEGSMDEGGAMNSGSMSNGSMKDDSMGGGSNGGSMKQGSMKESGMRDNGH
jgi:predicted metal-binding membrane protein